MKIADLGVGAASLCTAISEHALFLRAFSNAEFEQKVTKGTKSRWSPRPSFPSVKWVGVPVGLRLAALRRPGVTSRHATKLTSASADRRRQNKSARRIDSAVCAPLSYRRPHRSHWHRPVIQIQG